MYPRYMKTKMQILHPHLHNFVDVFLDWVGSTFSKLDSYNEKGSGSAALFIESFDVNW